MLSDDERRQILKTARESCAPQKVLIAGTGCESASETLRLTEFAADLGYDVALVRTPHFYRPQMQPQNLLAFYRTVADRSPIPIMIYSVPVFTKYDMPTELVAELADHPNIIGIKESGGDVEKIRAMAECTKQVKRHATVTETFAAVTPRMLKAATHMPDASGELVPVAALSGSGGFATVAEHSSAGQTGTPVPTRVVQSSENGKTERGFKTRQKEVNFQILAGSAQRLHASLAAGAVGGVLAFADPAPTACYEVFTAWKEGDEELARVKQERIAVAATRIVSELGIAAVKHAMDLNGYYGGPGRLPLLPLTTDTREEVDRLMADIRN